MAAAGMTPIAAEDGARLRGRWFRLRYSQSLAGQPVRPLVRLFREVETEEHLLAAAALGRGSWTWWAPTDLRRIELLVPTDLASSFRIDTLAPLGLAEVIARTLRRRPASLPPALWPGYPRRVRDVAVHHAFDLHEADAFERVLGECGRPFEPQGLDAALLADAAAGPRLGFVLAVAKADDLAAVSRTLTAFAAQIDDGFDMRIVAPGELHATLKDKARDAGVAIDVVAADGPAEAATLAAAGAMEASHVARLLPGDEPHATVVASLRAHLARHPEVGALYADSAVRDRAGRLLAQLKPDWSPLFQQGLDYVGRPCLVARPHLAGASSWRDLPGRVAARDGAAAVAHLKRVLFTLSHEVTPAEPAPSAPSVRAASHRPPAPHATLVVPTRDRADLLRRLCTSLEAHTAPGSYDLLVVDNGSSEREALDLLAALDARPGARVLRQPGPFNFSALVNAGARAAQSPILVLLNNDCEIVAPDWLDILARRAASDGIGAVGARLLYADGTLQHAGVALGLGGQAGHRDRKMPRDHPGHLGRLTVPHEVAAVTAACLAVRRDVFLEAGGFDETLPVAFNDIDFCLRLLRRGLRNVMEPGAVLLHAESASRGRDDGPRRERFRREAAAFQERWGELIRDDPYFHPMFSTFRFLDRIG